MEYTQLKELLFKHECKYPETHLTACITFASFGPMNKKEYPWESRTYLISSDNKAFQPNKGGYSIFGNCLDGSDQGVRLEQYIQEEYGGEDGWVVEDCGIMGYLLAECSDFSISTPKLFYTYDEALECMLSQLAETGELDAVQLNTQFTLTKDVFKADHYRANQDSAWLADSSVGWRWKIQPVCIYGPMKMTFPETGEE